MKKLLIYIVLFHSFGTYWIFGYAIPGVTSIAIDSNGQCIKFENEVRECTSGDLDLIYKLKKEYEQ